MYESIVDDKVSDRVFTVGSKKLSKTKFSVIKVKEKDVS